MKRIALLATFLALSLLVALGARGALADGGKGVTVQPLTPKPGDTITVKGDLLGPNAKVEVRVIGAGVDVDLGEVQANAEGDFQTEFRLPETLAPGTYQVQAKGADIVTTQITVTAAGATAPTAAGSAPMTTAPAERERPLGQTIGLVALFGVLAALGLFFARSARRETPSH